MALDFMTVPVMSAERERLFSTAGRMVTPLRNFLEASTIAMCQVLRSWLHAGIVDEVDPILLGTADDMAATTLAGDTIVAAEQSPAWLTDRSQWPNS